jgi:acyl-CoA hydrolase
LDFHTPIKLGEIVTLKASLNRAFRSSMEVGVLVTAQGLGSSHDRRANNAYLTFVAIDDHGSPVQVPQVVPETENEKRRYEEALVRRDLRLQRRQPSPK